jgi:hypothetical protein
MQYKGMRVGGLHDAVSALCFLHNERKSSGAPTRWGEWQCPNTYGRHAAFDADPLWFRWGMRLWEKRGERRYYYEEFGDEPGYWVGYRLPRVQVTCPLCHCDIHRRGAKHHWRLRPILSKRAWWKAYNKQHPF